MIIPMLMLAAGAVVSTGYSSLGLIMMGQSFHGLAMAGLW